MLIGVLNAGSATVKAALVLADSDTGARRSVRWRTSRAHAGNDDVRDVLLEVLDELAVEASGELEAVAHRVVHGGRRFSAPIEVDAAVLRQLDELSVLAPLHNPPAIAGLRAARDRFSDRPMLAVFDTAFHAGRAAESLRYALPWNVCDELGLYRYGFHGIAHASLLDALAQAEGRAPEQVDAVTLQLGGGCSACAIAGGRSIETSMGFSPLGGLPMATRPGDLDPGVVLALLRHSVREGWNENRLDDMLTRKSGLLGMTGSADMREVLRADAGGDERATLALALFVRGVVGTIGAYFTFLEGRGSLVFGGGIGTRSAEIRRRIAGGLEAWGICLDPELNSVGAPGRVSNAESRPVYVFETDEEALIATSAADWLKGRRSA